MTARQTVSAGGHITNINKWLKSFNTKNGRFLKKVFRAPKYAILRAFGKRLAYSELKNIDKSCPVIYAYLHRILAYFTG